MAAAVIFDTLKFADRLKEAGVAPPLAEAQARAFSEALGETDVVTKADLQVAKAELQADIWATKSEVRATRSDLQAEIQTTKSDLQAEIQTTRSDLQAEIQTTRSDLQAEIQDLRSDFRDQKTELRIVKWMVGVVIAWLMAVRLLPFVIRLP
jgi:gas vesicle protein